MSNDIQIGGRTLTVLFLLVIIAIFIQRSKTPRDPEGFPVQQFSDFDSEMNGAMVKARETLPEFLAALGEAHPSRELFGVKMRIKVDDANSYVWLADVSLEDEVFTGTLVNTPRGTRRFHAGQIMKVRSDNIFDWSYVEDGKLVGGYTMRVMWDRLSPEERRGLEAKLGFKID